MRTPTYAHGQTRHERAPKEEARQLTAEDPQVPEEQQAEARHLPGGGRFPRAAADNHRGGTPAAAGRGARPGRRGTERNGAERGGGPVRPRLRRPPRGCGAPRSPRSSSAERGPEGRCRPLGVARGGTDPGGAGAAGGERAGVAGGGYRSFRLSGAAPSRAARYSRAAPGLGCLVLRVSGLFGVTPGLQVVPQGPSFARLSALRGRMYVFTCEFTGVGSGRINFGFDYKKLKLLLREAHSHCLRSLLQLHPSRMENSGMEAGVTG